MDLEHLKKLFFERYGEVGTHVFYSPGRVNLIGEHIDYNGGYVFPCALDMGTYAVVSVRDDNHLKFASTNFDLDAEVLVDDIKYDEKYDWVNYPLGVLSELMKEGKSIGGLNILYSGNIPNGSGLSSSASIEVLTAVIANDIFNLGIDMVTLVKLSQRAENFFIGVMCGIMDQFAVGMGKKDHAMLLNCKTLDYKHVPIVLDGYYLVIANTNKRRGLADSKYNERRSECESALKDLQEELDISCLCDLSKEQFDTNSHLIKDPIHLKRATHVVYENDRTKRAVDVLEKNDILEFGMLMKQSHESLKELYEVSGNELDVLAESAAQFDGCIGARMTGAGFGGCTVNIVKKECVDAFINEIGLLYEQKTGLKADFYVTNVGDGATRIN